MLIRFFSAQQLRRYTIEPLKPTVSQPLFRDPHPICATEGGSKEEETQTEGGESESKRQVDSTLTPCTLL